MTSSLVLLGVALIVFAGIFGFLWSLDSKVSKLTRELRDEAADE